LSHASVVDLIQHHPIGPEMCTEGRTHEFGDREPHSPAATGNARSRTASAAKEQRLADVVRLEVWAQGEDTLRGLAVSHEGNDSRNWNPKTAKARNSPIWRGL
jgi:hypothetical protein